VVFVSGIAASCLNWVGVQRAVSPHALTVTSDRAGLGWSDLGPRRLTAADHAVHLRTALRSAGVPPPFLLVAHSYGSFVAQFFAARFEADVAGLLLLDPISWREWADPGPVERRMLRGGAAFARVGAALAALGIVGFAVKRFRGGAEGVGRAVLGSFGQHAVKAVSRVMGEVGKMPPDTWDAIQHHWSRPRSFIAMARHFGALPRSARLLRDQQSKGTSWAFPLVVLGAAGNPTAVRAMQGDIARLSSRGRYEAVTGAGHWVHLDRPEVVQGAILDMARAWTEGPVAGGRSPVSRRSS
jgi:pimeloyl-ACP methyl ester carboxylesterase